MTQSSSLSRRHFLQRGGGSVVAAASLVAPAEAATSARPASGEMPRQPLALESEIPKAQGLRFHYPDEASPCLLLRMDQAVPGGVGPGQNLVAYSTLCSHMGCPVRYEAETQVFKCDCHFSIFDAEKQGQMVCGQAVRNLPRIRLDHDARSGRVTAVGVDGLIFGRVDNLLGGA